MSARSKPCSGQRHFSQHGLRSATPPRTSRRRQWTAASLDLESGRTGTGCLLLHTTLPLLRGRVQQPHQAGASRRGHLLPPASSGSLHPPTNHYREDVERWPTGWRYQSQPKRDSCCNASRCWLLADVVLLKRGCRQLRFLPGTSLPGSTRRSRRRSEVKGPGSSWGTGLS